MRYLSVCSGIEAASVAWEPLGFTPAGFAEIDRFPSAVLAHHYPAVTNYGDFTTIKADDIGPIDILVGGTPCQSFSVAGLRGGLADDRGNLALEFCRLALRARPRWLVWENVPGVMSSNGGRDFGSILAGLAECGYRFACRILDAQYAGVPQRRRRVFVVGYLGDWRRPAQVLFERHCLQGHSPPSREAGEVAPAIPARRTGGGGLGTDFDCDGGLIASTGWLSHCLNAGGMGRLDYETETFITQNTTVRRLTPLECERLQGFPDGYTAIPYRGKAVINCPDGPRYKAIGNSMAVPVMRWIGERIKMVDGGST